MANIVPAQTDKSSRKQVSRWAFYFFAFVIAMVIVAFASFTIWRWQLRREINARNAAIRANGLPVDWEDLKKWPKEVSDAENAALIYTNAIAQLDPEGATNRRIELPARSGPYSVELRAVLANEVAKNRAALDIAYTASTLSDARYPIKDIEGPATKLPHLSDLKRIVQLLEYEAILKAQSGDARGAAKAVDASLHVARSLDNEPFFISQLVGAGSLTTSCDGLERILCRVPLSDELLGQLSAQLVSAEATNRFLTGLIGDRALNSELMRLAQDDMRRFIAIANQGVGDGEKTDLPSRNPGIGWRFLGVFERDRNFYLRAMETNIEVATALPPVSLSMTNEMEKLIKQAQSGVYLLSSMLLPASSRLAERDASSRATLRTAIAAIAIERWRNAHQGIIPNSLDDLVPSFLPSAPLDPFNGQPLKFKKTAKGYVVYSIGPDRQDDGGKEKPPRSAKVPLKQQDHFDITFTVERQ